MKAYLIDKGLWSGEQDDSLRRFSKRHWKISAMEITETQLEDIFKYSQKCLLTREQLSNTQYLEEVR